MLTVTYAECHTLALYAECPYAQCHYVECHYAECRGAHKLFQTGVLQQWPLVNNIKLLFFLTETVGTK